MNAPQLPPESSFSKASVSETSPRTLSENVEFSPNLSPNLFVYFFFFPPPSSPSPSPSFSLSSSKTKVFMKCLIPLTNSAAKGCRSSPERVETASRAAAAAAAAAVDCEKKNEKRKKKKKT